MQVSLTEAAASLSDLVEAAINGEEVIILLNGGEIPENNHVAIKLMPVESVKLRPKFGSAKGLIWMSDDFDEPLEELKDYMK